nr:S8 family peptidase [uncultured Amphritea sp.]
MSQSSRNQPHFFLGPTGQAESFTSPSSGGGKGPDLPDLDRKTHGQKLMSELNEVKSASAAIKESLNRDELAGPIGIQIEFKGLPGVELAFQSLASERSSDGAKNIELMSVVQRESNTFATVFVPEGQIKTLEKKITEYLEEKTNKAGKPADNKALINTIDSIRQATIEALWTDTPEVYPQQDDEVVWWEVWLPVRGNRQSIINDFTRYSEAAEMEVSSFAVEFPERTVLLVKGTKQQLSSSVVLLNSIAELRLAKETADFFDALPPVEQHEWANELLARTTCSDESAVRVCILDTGVNSGHPLLAPVMNDDDSYVVEPSWDTADADGHGTEMAGLAAWGDLTCLMESSESHQIPYCLESVKLLRYGGDNVGRHLGDLTAQGVSLPEIDKPGYPRVFSMALSAKDARDRGRPSAWSASLDSLAVDYVNEGQDPRLIVVCAGNVSDNLTAMKAYPEFNLVEDIHDPAQAWNVLTAGAYTEKVNISESDTDHYNTLAPEGGLSPFSTTASTWLQQAPVKPELVLEGGNAAADEVSAAHMSSLSLLTTNADVSQRLLTTTRATSAATALLSKMAAEVMTEYPHIWPETVRALLVHSADWTDALKAQFDHGNTARQKYAYLLRCCGYGVPSLSRALKSAENSLTMVIEDQLQPFFKEKGAPIKTRDMHLHKLPWPIEVLQDLGSVPVMMTVTLSYFIEPNPSARGVKGRYNYQSHGLRFDVKRPLESQGQFRARINERARREEEASTVGGGDPDWVIGSDNRHRGSIHKDIWHGTAADLAERGCIAVYPAMGWWRTRQRLNRYESLARYSLVVSIETPETDVDIYSVVKNEIGITTKVVV